MTAAAIAPDVANLRPIIDQAVAGEIHRGPEEDREELASLAWEAVLAALPRADPGRNWRGYLYTRARGAIRDWRRRERRRRLRRVEAVGTHAAPRWALPGAGPREQCEGIAAERDRRWRRPALTARAQRTRALCRLVMGGEVGWPGAVVVPGDPLAARWSRPSHPLRALALAGEVGWCRRPYGWLPPRPPR